MNSNLAIDIQNLTKIFRIYNNPQDRLKQSLFGSHKKYYREFQALNKINFQIKKGETVGIIGRNGSGKSTLLQIIAGTLAATSGEVSVYGRIAALLELGSGFNPEFTGRENVYLNAAILGISREEIERRFDDILKFADIGDFIDQPVKTYSSGMYVRLAFAVSINVDPDILIVDEALAVGDGRFQLKCFEKIKSLKKTGKTILVVSHDLQTIRQICDTAILIDKGNLIDYGKPNEVVNHYTKILFDRQSEEESELDDTQNEFKGANSEDSLQSKEYRYGNKNGIIEKVFLLNQHGDSTKTLDTCEEFEVIMEVQVKKDIKQPIFAMTIKTIKGLEVYGTNTYFQGLPFRPLTSGETVKISFRQACALLPGEYFISLGFVELNDGEIVPLDRRYDVLELKVLPIGQDRSFGLANLASQIKLDYHLSDR
ncbi:ABC transporter ATP-binding protein [Paenibacillus sp. tmac-D7]|uniref:ABC transporter ATP-binding protein n=1 Tax=Paenibacillus sp. tmac-D7 TaxID=2591462 RepID=UPI0011441AE2|nr:ABC transporter ATP-binding protein [Paenibacillus sp. tmac-D7]